MQQGATHQQKAATAPSGAGSVHRLVPPGASPPPAQAEGPTGAAGTLGLALLREGLITSDALVQALASRSWRRGRLAQSIALRGMMSPADLAQAMARHWQTTLIDPMAHTPDVQLMDRLGIAECLRHSLLPVAQVGGATLVATAHPEEFPRHRDRLTALFGPVCMAIATPDAISRAILHLRGPRLARAAEERVDASESCRDLPRRALGVHAALAALVTLALVLAAPLAALWALVAWVLVTLVLSTGLKLAAGLAAARAASRKALQPPAPPLTIAIPPTVSLIVALYKESTIAPRLIERLARIDYPHDLLDVILVIEEDDAQTRTALAGLDLPPWLRVLVAPRGRVQTKPRALNFALEHCRGSIIGIYDAEDAPAPDQIQRVVDRFHQRGAEVACLQGVLDFYNPHTNWLARCFTIEYAAWFRLVLPGMLRLGLPIPLGGTTLFFRRPALEAVGGWDAHNVTEDADLGIRLYRHGYRTDWIDTVTREEANCRALPWVKQRSRWLKGYMMTWATHMRAPRRLLAELGPWQFFGFQVLFLGTLSQFLLAPVLWSFWLAFFGLPHPIADALPQGAFLLLMGTFLFSELVNITMGVVGLRLSGQKLSPLWVPTLHLYFPLGVLAGYKALWEVLRRPFYWDKTTHGHFDMAADRRLENLRSAQPFRRNSPASTRSRVSKARLMCVFRA